MDKRGSQSNKWKKYFCGNVILCLTFCLSHASIFVGFPPKENHPASEQQSVRSPRTSLIIGWATFLGGEVALFVFGLNFCCNARRPDLPCNLVSPPRKTLSACLRDSRSWLRINSNKEEKQMKKGIVTASFPKRSYAFIHDDETGEEIFAHASDFPDRTVLPVGSLVEFEIGTFKNRPKAIKISPVASQSAPSAENLEVR